MNREKREFIGPNEAIPTGDKLGPGYYFTEETEAKKIGPSFPKKGRAASSTQKDNTLGPGQYYSSTREFSNRPEVNLGSFGRASRSDFKYGATPGPGQYGTLRGKQEKRGGGFTFGKSTKMDNKQVHALGPGQYSKKRQRVFTQL